MKMENCTHMKFKADVKVARIEDKGRFVAEIHIRCIDCGAERTIKIQDAFQVIRCAACQKKAQNKKRAAKKKEANRTASLERRLEEARKLIAEHDSQKANEE